MARAFSVASWNVEHFKDGDPARIGRVVGFLSQVDPDVFAIYEVEGKEVFGALTTRMPGYTFHITEGDQTQEILVGVRQTLTAFVTQRTEFKSGVFRLRPGMLVTITVDGQNYPVLFLHTNRRRWGDRRGAWATRSAGSRMVGRPPGEVPSPGAYLQQARPSDMVQTA